MNKLLTKILLDYKTDEIALHDAIKSLKDLTKKSFDAGKVRGEYEVSSQGTEESCPDFPQWEKNIKP